MSPKKASSSERAQSRQKSDPKVALTPLTAPAQQAPLARIPSPARFFLVVLSSLVVSSVLFTLTSSLTLNDLGLVSKHREEWWEVGGLVAWRAVEVGLAWVVGLDSKLNIAYRSFSENKANECLTCRLGCRIVPLLDAHAHLHPFILLLWSPTYFGSHLVCDHNRLDGGSIHPLAPAIVGSQLVARALRHSCQPNHSARLFDYDLHHSDRHVYLQCHAVC
jgi:hypothetical protein